MARFRRELRHRIALIGSVLAVAVFIALLPARFTAPARSVFTQAVGPAEDLAFNTAGDALAAAGTLREAIFSQERQRRLEGYVERLLVEKSALEEKLRSQQVLMESLAELRVQGFPHSALSARVTSYDANPMRQSITINAGSRDAVREGLAVTSAGAVVGKVIETGPWVSRVRLLTDPASTLSCRVSRTRSLCILQGTGGVNCSAEWLTREADVEQGDVLVTAPLLELISEKPLIPPGLPVATVKRIERSATLPLFLGISAEPAVNLERIEMVEVIIPAE